MKRITQEQAAYRHPDAALTRLERQAQLERTRQALGLGTDTTRAKLEMYNAQLAPLDAVLAAISRLP